MKANNAPIRHKTSNLIIFFVPNLKEREKTQRQRSPPSNSAHAPYPPSPLNIAAVPVSCRTPHISHEYMCGCVFLFAMSLKYG